MRIRSLGDLDLTRSWARVLYLARQELMDIPDRLPFEVAARFWGDSPRLSEEHRVRQPLLVMATKRADTTVRPFVRIHPADYLLYQALVDRCAPAIEEALGPRNEVIAYRVSPIEADDPFDGSPRWRAFQERTRELCSAPANSYVLQADVSSYFVGIDIDELERRLFEIRCPSSTVRDLGDLLRSWVAQGIAGLPQGVGPSSVLANFYLHRIDECIRSSGLEFTRYMDDVVVTTGSHHQARETLDEIEQRLFEDGLSLGSRKTRILRSASLLFESTPQERIEAGLQGIMITEGFYEIEREPTDEELGEIRAEEVSALFADAVGCLRSDEYRRAELIFALRYFTRKRSTEAIPDLDYVLLRMPGLTAEACRYLESIVESDASEVSHLLFELTSERFHRPQEWINLLRVVQVAPSESLSNLSARLAELSREHPHELVRARAIVAWGRQTDSNDFSAVDNFVTREQATWVPYAMVAIQGKDVDGRSARFDRWGSLQASLARLGESLRRAPIAVKKI